MPPAQAAARDEERVDITSLTPQELANLRDRVEADFERLADSQTMLNRLISRFNASALSIERLAAAKEGQPMLLPLTGSLYVSGSVADTSSVLIDIGTGYYVKMDTQQGLDYCQRKMAGLKENMDLVGQAAADKRRALVQINGVLEDKLAQAQAVQRKA